MTELALTLRPGAPLHVALYEALRHAVLNGPLAPGDSLPSTRALAEQLGLSRGTVVAVFEQLKSEGYFAARVGSGTVVAEELPDLTFMPATQTQHPQQAPAPKKAPAYSRWGRTLEVPFPLEATKTPRPFRPHVPAVDAFPLELWSRLVARRARRDDSVWLGTSAVNGYLPLRKALVEHLRTSRGITTSPDCIVLMPSAQQALDLTARLFIDPGDQVWLEDPGYVGALAAFRASHAKIIPVPVDARGLIVSEGLAAAPNAKLVYVTPGHQWPLGVTLAIERRLELLAWARAKNRIIIEDDYDSEYRYEGRPVAALKSLDTDDVVIHVGAFSKTILPSLRLAYAVVPERMVDTFLAAKTTADRHTPVLAQAALTDFIEEGHFGRHLRRMRPLYAERRAALFDALTTEVGGLVEPIGSRAGLGFAVRLPKGINDVALSELLATQGVESMPISPQALLRHPTPALLLGFAPYAPVRLKAAAQTLSACFEPKFRSHIMGLPTDSPRQRG